MHEFSLMTGIMDIALEEMRKHGATRLRSVRVRYGALSQVMPEAMRMAFEGMIAGSVHAGASLDLVEEPILARCHACAQSFTPPDRRALFGLCPLCGELAAYKVERGEGLWLDHLEAD